MKIRVDCSNKNLAKIAKAVRENQGYCPCKLEHLPENKCPCRDFICSDDKRCGCGMYIREE